MFVIFHIEVHLIDKRSIKKATRFITLYAHVGFFCAHKPFTKYEVNSIADNTSEPMNFERDHVYFFDSLVTTES